MLIDHVGLAVKDAVWSQAFFTKALAPLDIAFVARADTWTGFGRRGDVSFWFYPHDSKPAPTHIAFAAESPEQVDAFHAAALAAGGIESDAPANREFFGQVYYGGSVTDQNGHIIEAVYRQP